MGIPLLSTGDTFEGSHTSLSLDSIQSRVFQLITECGADLISIHDRDGLYLFASDNCHRLFGWYAEQLLGTDVYDYCHPNDVAALRAHHESPGDSTIEYRFKTSCGSYIWVETSSRTYLHAGTLERICFTRDISERLKLKEANIKLAELAKTDALTQIGNYLAFKDRVDSLLLEAERGRRFSIVLADIDHFKRFNDAHGHHAGDHVLQSVASALRESIRKVDFVARYGGEEFVLLLPDTEPIWAHVVAERLRRSVSSLVLPYGQVTMSYGVCSYDHEHDRDSLVKCADRALYKAKGLGRDRVEICDHASAGYG